MNSSSSDSNPDNRYEFRSENPTVSRLVRPSDDLHTSERQTLDSSLTPNRRREDDLRRTRDSAYESVQRSRDDQYPNQQETERRSIDYSRRVPTANIIVDPTRRPGDGNPRTCVMEINIAVSMGGNRPPQASVISSNILSKPPNIRSTATIDGARYIDLSLQSPNYTAQLATDGVLHDTSSSSQKHMGYDHTNK